MVRFFKRILQTAISIPLLIIRKSECFIHPPFRWVGFRIGVRIVTRIQLHEHFQVPYHIDCYFQYGKVQVHLIVLSNFLERGLTLFNGLIRAKIGGPLWQAKITEDQFNKRQSLYSFNFLLYSLIIDSSMMNLLFVSARARLYQLHFILCALIFTFRLSIFCESL
jgi:hypothetical protein